MEDLRTIAAASREELPAFTYYSRHVRGKVRHIAAPNWAMRIVHHALIEHLRLISGINRVVYFSHGAFNRGNTVQNAARHARNRYVYQLDITDAYPSVPLDRLADVLNYLDPSLGTVAEIQEFLECYCSGEHGGLAVGGPASPALFDLYCAVEIDSKLRRVAPRVTYSRYLDDLTISQNDPIPSILRKRVREIVVDAGFRVSHPKSSLTDRTKRPVTITGVTITRNGMIRPAEPFLGAVRELFAKKTLSGLGRRERSRLHGFSGHLSQFKDGTDWPMYEVSPDVMHLKARVQKALGLTKEARRYKDGSYARFPEWFLDEIRQQVPLEDVIRPWVKKWRKFGDEFIAQCPFHQEKTASFTVSPRKGFYHCFGCSAHGDAIRFLTDHRGLSFPDAVHSLAQSYGIREY